MEHYTKVLKNYSDFSTRATRTEYWMFTLINFLIMVGISVIVGTMGKFISVVVLVIYGLFIIIPYFAVSVRRLHDTNRSGLWLLISPIPLGGLVLLVFNIIDSTPGSNLYGPNPKEGSAVPPASTTPTATV